MQSMERISAFIKSYIWEEEGALGEIYKKAMEEKVPVIRPETREFLKTQILLAKPKQILELGTAVGYSALFMCRYLEEDAHITTIEIDEVRAKTACENIQRLGEKKRITVLNGDAMEMMETLSDSGYDFAFVDAAKAQYIHYLPELLRLVRVGGVIVTDNILQEGEILESHFAVEKRNRTIHDRMREYLLAITGDSRLETAILPVADGVALSVRME